jgi:carbon monoxide dehydrogenase subunit G
MSKMAIDANAKPIQVLRPTTTYTVNVSGSAAASSAISANVRVARIITTAPVYYSVTGTATTSSAYLPSETIEYIHVYEGDTVSFITDGSTGVAYVTEMV